MKTQIKSSQLSEKTIINLPLEEKIFWLNWIKGSISRRESTKHIDWLKKLYEKIEFNLSQS